MLSIGVVLLLRGQAAGGTLAIAVAAAVVASRLSVRRGVFYSPLAGILLCLGVLSATNVVLIALTIRILTDGRPNNLLVVLTGFALLISMTLTGVLSFYLRQARARMGPTEHSGSLGG
jgi:hypothetical protein